MANIYMESYDVPALGNKYLFVQPDGSYPDMTAGQLNTSIHDTDLVPYVFRKTPFRSTRETDKLVGASVAWNQQIQNGNFASALSGTWGTIGSATRTVANNTLTITSSAVNAINQAVQVIKDHVYIESAFLTSTITNISFGLYKNASATVTKGVSAANTRENVYSIFKPSNVLDTDSFDIRIRVNVATSATVVIENVIFCDLTLALGPAIADYIYTLESGTAGAGIAKLREWGFFDKPYYAHNAGGIESVNVSKHRMVGFNAWDEILEDGGINDTTGQDASASGQKRSANYIKVLPSTNYYAKFPNVGSGGLWVYFYDGDKSFVGRAYVNSAYNVANTVIPTPSNCHYIRFKAQSQTQDYSDICINISYAAQNGQYEPYTVHEYPLADVTLRGILKLDGSNNLYADGDVYESDGTVTRKYGIIDLGSLEWTYYTSGSHPVFRVSVSGRKYGSNASGVAGIAQDYVFVGNDTLSNIISAMPDKSIGFQETNAFIMIRDDSYTSEATFKTAMNGKYLVYPLATPTTDTADPYTNPQVCSPYGTEEYVDRAVAAGTRDVSIPCGHETEYAKDIVGAIEGIPFPPTTNGNYKLRVSVASGVTTYSWESE